MNAEAKLVALGGLLHDIGKFVQRANWYRNAKTHEDWGFEFLSKYARDELEKLPLFAKYHHEKELTKFPEKGRTKNLLYIVCQADNISSSERLEPEDKKLDVSNPIVSVLTEVDLRKGKIEKMTYELRKFDQEFFFPKSFESVRVTVDDYRRLFEEFEGEFEKAFLRSSFNHLLYVLEKYTTFIPAMVSENNDISLYDHLRTTSAIALCMYYYHQHELDEDIVSKIKSDDKKFLLVGGDISGIQDFIYTITSKGTLKLLRARSAYLELLVEDVVEELVEKLKLTRANVVYSGGGKFYLLAPNTSEAKEVVERVREELNEWLFEKFREKLYFAIDYIELSGKELESFSVDSVSLWSLIGKKLKRRKLRKFLDEGAIDFVENYITEEECEVCRIPHVKLEKINGVNYCEACEEFYYVGEKLPKIRGFVRVKCNTEHNKHDEVKEKYTMPFSTFYCFFDEPGDFPPGSKVFLKNGYESYELYDTIPYYVCDYTAKEGSSIKSFDDLAKAAKGAKKIAVLRMDVDDLGKVFTVGLRDLKGGTFSRMATLSRLLNNFFKNCVRLVADGKVKVDAPRISGTSKKEIVVVYSGGDDLFVVGAWDHVFEFAFEVNALFRKYVGNNPNVTISAGYAIFDPKFPLCRMAEVTGRREELAKEEGVEVKEGEEIVKINGQKIKRKGRICLSERDWEGKTPEMFKVSYEWDEFVRVWNSYVSKLYDGELKCPRSVIRKILDARKEYTRNPEGFRWMFLLIYYLSRAKLIEELGELARRDAEKVRKKKPLDIFLVGTPLKLVDLAIRG